MAPSATCWCGHCGAVRRLRAEGEFASCAVCGRVLLDLQDDAVAAPPPRQLRRRQRRARDGAAARDIGARPERGDISDAESTVTSTGEDRWIDEK
ncbi:hypothetical protein Zm00014a_042034 [Zea mays]|jgi:hypothetical protein|uniref:Uncharacterized protein n=2 Tax=Zea mays TaxID=4577 RepID=K7UUG7_MAIZE|nr:hypothetical protein ZEAMMB73_Zm00001d009923 [Zea mays]PWZ11730.1 hypothetical protein Zm00014a_042034 [Zea mays]